MESIKNSCCRSVAPGLNEEKKSDDIFVFPTRGGVTDNEKDKERQLALLTVFLLIPKNIETNTHAHTECLY